jgi:hypothetical protein
LKKKKEYYQRDIQQDRQIRSKGYRDGKTRKR